MPKIALTAEMKTRIVTELACYTAPSKIRDLIKAEHGVTLGITTIIYYDPDTAGTEVAAKWKKLFLKTREDFDKRCGRVPITRQAYRFAKMQHVLDVEEGRDNTVGMRETLELAAKEEGGAFTNKREITGSITLEDIIREAAGKPAAGNDGDGSSAE